MNNSEILSVLLNSDKELIIYRNSEKNNFEIYTDFAEKINLNIGNLDKFLNKLEIILKFKIVNELQLLNLYVLPLKRLRS